MGGPIGIQATYFKLVACLLPVNGTDTTPFTDVREEHPRAPPVTRCG